MPNLSAGLGAYSAGLLTEEPVSYRARVSPERTACIEIASGEALTYAALDERIARAAGFLESLLGDPAGERVAVLARNGTDQIVIALACQRIGAVFAPLNWRLGANELAAILADCAPALLIVAEEFAAAARTAAEAKPGVTLLIFEGPDGAAAQLRATAPVAARPAGAEAPCILLYTSGTTGQPKGVVITRRNAFFSAINFAFVGEIGPASVVLSDLPLFHTIGLVAVARTTLTFGGTLVLSDRFTPPRSLAFLTDPAIGVTHYFAVPQMITALRNDPGYPGADLSRLHAIFVGGAPLTKTLIESCLDDGVVLVNGYGMSEAGTAVHVPIDRDAVRANPGSVGLPAPCIEVRIVDPVGVDVPEGTVGELWLRGPTITPGYWNRPAETAAAFTDGWYRTGDLGFREANGFIRVVDRLKDMFISGGENVYPAEIEAALLAHPAVQEAAVIGVPDARWGETGHAFIVPRPGRNPTIEEIALHCEARLARFKLPARILIVETIPRTASGKVQKHLLRREDAAAS